jgi:GAF domain-containing protein
MLLGGVGDGVVAAELEEAFVDCVGEDVVFVVTIAVSEQLARELDQLQIDAGEGPCLDVLAGATSEYVADLDGDDRWPRFSVGAVAAGVRSVLALHLGRDATYGVLYLYARLPHAFGPTDRAQGGIFASHAGIALMQRRQHADDATRRSSTTWRPQHTRGDRAGPRNPDGTRHRISARQAFNILRRASQHLNVKLKDVA